MATAALGTGCQEQERCWVATMDYREGVVIDEPAQLDAFSGRCVAIVGNLVVEGEKVFNLDGLEGVVAVHGSIRLRSPSLRSTSGLSGVEYVSRSVLVSDAPSLERFEMESLRSIGGDLSLARLPRLFDLDGTPELVEVGQSVALRELDALAEMNLPEIEVIGRNLYIENNPQLESVHEDGVLFEVGNYFRIRGNPRLRSVSGFNGLDRIGTNLRIGNNSRDGYRDEYPTLDPRPRGQPGTVKSIRIDHNGPLEEVSGFESLQALWTSAAESTQAVSSITVSDNASLAHLDAFSGLSGTRNPTPDLSVWTSVFVFIEDNPALVRLPRFATLDARDGDVTVDLFVERNASLESLADFGRWQFSTVNLLDNAAFNSMSSIALYDSGSVRIIGNDSLKTLDGLAFARAATHGSRLTINDNDQLEDVTSLLRAANLSAYSVEILGNPSLPQAQAAWVAVAVGNRSGKVAANAGWLPADPCPFTEDFECDETQVHGERICQVGTDEVDCAQ